MTPRPILKPVFKYLIHPYWRFRRGQTLGVRGVITDDKDRVLLVRHSYAPGWMFPGGGVERDETLGDALRRECDEEVGVTFEDEPELFGVYANFRHFRSDHVAVFLVSGWRRQPRKSLEIGEQKFFPRAALPEGTTMGTRRRLEEIFDHAPQSADW